MACAPKKALAAVYAAPNPARIVSPAATRPVPPATTALETAPLTVLPTATPLAALAAAAAAGIATAAVPTQASWRLKCWSVLLSHFASIKAHRYNGDCSG